MITEGTLELLAKVGANNGVIGFWYPNTLTFVVILLCFCILCFLAIIGLFTILKALFSKKKKY